MFDKLKIHARHGIESPICERWLKFCEGHEVHIHKDYNKWHDAGTYIADLVANNKGIVINCDIDCFVMDWGIVRAIIKHMKINGIGYAGVRDDAATIPHRGNSREVMNPFKFLGEKTRNVDPRPTKEMDLLIKLLEACPTFVVDKCFR